MLRKWLRAKYPDVLKKKIDLGFYEEIVDWMSEEEEDIWHEYLEIIKPSKILESLLLGLPVGSISLKNIENLSISEFIDLSVDMEISFDDNIQLF